MKETEINIQGSAGLIELRINGLLESEALAPPKKGLVVICHPHPLYGGTLDNKVVSTVARAYENQGWVAVRFNFRDAGSTEGQQDNEGEELGAWGLDDLKTVIDWAQAEYVNTYATLSGSPALAVAGFSFGGAIAAAYARDNSEGDTGLNHAVLISPALGRYGFLLDDKINCPLLLTQGEDDETLDPNIVYQWVAANQRDQLVLRRLADTGHFYHRKLVPLKNHLLSFLENI